MEFKTINQASVSIGTDLNQFINDIDSLADTLPNTLIIIQAVQAAASHELLKFGNKNIGIQETSGDKVVLKASLDTFQQAQRLNTRIQKAISASKLIPRSFVISLISQYDAFLGRLIRTLFLIKPESLSMSEKNISFAQLQTFESIEDAKEYILEKESLYSAPLDLND